MQDGPQDRADAGEGANVSQPNRCRFDDVVDRRGVEPLTSAVQRRQHVCQQLSSSVTESRRVRDISGPSATEWHQVVRRGMEFVCGTVARAGCGTESVTSRAAPASPQAASVAAVEHAPAPNEQGSRP